MDFFGWDFRWIPVRYHEQWEESGTWAAIKWIEASGELVIAYADAIISKEDIAAVMNEEHYSVLVKEVSNPEKYGIFESDKYGFAVKIMEKPQEYIGNLANFSFFKVDDSILKYVQEVGLSPRWEIELTDAINLFVKTKKLRLIHLQNDIVDITTLEDLKAANTLTKPVLWETTYLESIWDYELHLGIPQSGIQEIVNYSLDETDIALREWTSDWKKRFISVENLSSWYDDDDRYSFTLLSTDWVVAGLWWGRPAKSPTITETLDTDLYKILQGNTGKTHTSAIRIYPFARWDRLASPFMAACSRYYNQHFENVHMCVDIDEQNIPSQKAFEKIWFQKIGYGKNINNSPESGRKRFVYMRIS